MLDIEGAVHVLFGNHFESSERAVSIGVDPGLRVGQIKGRRIFEFRLLRWPIHHDDAGQLLAVGIARQDRDHPA
jgi:hypothetical protein